ncbi:alkaline phosphatase family protein [Microlunatus ginsengisoli]|uniref:alkaline phosphatase family protein n=1 Tax=Microlunatus ginsengisoli TaxID=363863 RepID=UPI0031D876E0
MLGATLVLAVALAAGGCQPVARQPAAPSDLPSIVPSSSITPGPPATETATPATTPATTPSDPSGATPSSTPTPADQVDHVLAISVDALNPDAITRLGPAGTPTLHRLIREGATTLNARSEQELTITLPNHTGMFTGRRVSAKHGGHGVTFNVDNGTTVHRAAGAYVASVFDVVHDRGGSTALYSGKKKFAFFARSWNTAGAPDRIGRDDGRRKIDTVVLDTDNARLVRALDRRLVSAPPQFTFLHLSLPDVAGHAHGFMGKDYLAAVRQTDRLLGQVIATIDERPTLRRHTVVVLTADHGGLGASHDDPTKIADYRIPLVVWGSGVAANDLYRLNPGFVDPGRSRPGYAGPQPIRNGDVANLATGLLGLPAVPGSQLDRGQSLVVGR